MTWIAARKTGESSGASAIANNAIKVWNLSLSAPLSSAPSQVLLECVQAELGVSRPQYRPLKFFM